MTHDFVLVDVVPGREEEVREALGKMEEVQGIRELPARLTPKDYAVLVEEETHDDISSLLTNEMKWIDGVYAVQKDHSAAGLDVLDDALEQIEEFAGQEEAVVEGQRDEVLERLEELEERVAELRGALSEMREASGSGE